MKCNKKTSVFARIVGYYQPVQQWNKGKRDEFADRNTFDSSIGGGEYNEDSSEAG
jgi:ribonucleoside-triphosphate reductase